MKRMGTALFGATALLAAGAAMADQPEWNWLQAGYVTADNGFDDDTNAFELEGSIGFGLGHAQINYIDGEEEGSPDADFDGYTVVVGIHPQLNENGQYVLEAAWMDGDYEPDGQPDGDVDGIGLAAGLRYNLTDRFELSSKVTWTDLEWDMGGGKADFTDVGVELAGRYAWTENLSTGVTVNINDTISDFLFSGDALTLDVRWAFGQIL